MASDYETAFGDDLAQLKLDRAMLDAATEGLPNGAAVLDLGCGTGSVGRYLSAKGRRLVVGLDLSLGMLRATPMNLGRRRVQGDLRTLPVGSSSFEIVVAFYSLHHLARPELPTALAEARRVLRSGGRFLMATHLGTGEVVTSEFLGHRVEAVGGSLYSVDQLTSELERAGLQVTDARTREPLAHEYPTRRIYLLAHR